MCNRCFSRVGCGVSRNVKIILIQNDIVFLVETEAVKALNNAVNDITVIYGVRFIDKILRAVI